jgi:ribosomal-protein-alanine N-acetyltransferase
VRIALAQLPHPTTFDGGLAEVLAGIAAAAARGARVVCFPECALAGMRGTDFPVVAPTAEQHDGALERARAAAAAHRVAVILPTERPHGAAWQNGAWVIAADGGLLGYQSKNQLPPEEEPFFVPGASRRIFELEGVKVGVVICHEGWRYPETVRWAAARGAALVFHPSFCGAAAPADEGPEPPWGATYYERVMACRAGENHVWFASVNHALPRQECRSTVVAPDGEPAAIAPRNAAALLVADIDPAAATGWLARRLAPERYPG